MPKAFPPTNTGTPPSWICWSHQAPPHQTLLSAPLDLSTPMTSYAWFQCNSITGRSTNLKKSPVSSRLIWQVCHSRHDPHFRIPLLQPIHKSDQRQITGTCDIGVIDTGVSSNSEFSWVQHVCTLQVEGNLSKVLKGIRRLWGNQAPKLWVVRCHPRSCSKALLLCSQADEVQVKLRILVTSSCKLGVVHPIESTNQQELLFFLDLTE